MKPVPVVCLSHKRADRVLTKKAIANVVLCVPESQAPEYRRHNPEIELVLHPDSVVGLSPKRQWVYEKFGDCFQVDDDVRSVNRLWPGPGSKIPSRMEPAAAYDVIQNVYGVACDLDAKLFGLNSFANAYAFNGIVPFRFTGYVNGGGIGHRTSPYLKYPPHAECRVVEDYYICLLNAFYHRHIVVDLRFALSPVKTFKNRGGMAEFRSLEIEKEDYFYLRRKFGGAIQPRKEHHTNKASHPWQRSIHLPF